MNQKNIVCLKERMKGEGRVALTPDGCLRLKILGHEVSVESGAGEKSRFTDRAYRLAGAEVLSILEIIPLLQSPDAVVLKVKQPLPEDDVWLSHMKNGVLLAYFHTTGTEKTDRHTIDALLKQNITAITYENVEKNGGYPLLAPMSEIAGRLAAEWGERLSQEARVKFSLPQMKRQYLQMVIFGAGTVGFAAIKKGLELGFSSITVFEKEAEKEHFLREHLTPAEMSQVRVFLSGNPIYEIAKARELQNTDLLVGAVLVPGGHAPIVVSEKEVKTMSKGSVIVDVACDQGGCIWHPENENTGIFEYEGKTFCRTPNMPGSVPEEATPILAKAIFPYLLKILDLGAEDACAKDIGLLKGLLTHSGDVMNEKAARHWGVRCECFPEGDLV